MDLVNFGFFKTGGGVLFLGKKTTVALKRFVWILMYFGKSHEKLDHRNRLNFQVEQDTTIEIVSSQTEAAAAQSP